MENELTKETMPNKLVNRVLKDMKDESYTGVYILNFNCGGLTHFKAYVEGE